MSERPPALDVRTNAETAAALLAEIDAALDGPRWRLRPDTEGGQSQLYVAACLRHTAMTLADVIANAARNADMAVRGLARSMFEGDRAQSFLDSSRTPE